MIDEPDTIEEPVNIRVSTADNVDEPATDKEPVIDTDPVN